MTNASKVAIALVAGGVGLTVSFVSYVNSLNREFHAWGRSLVGEEASVAEASMGTVALKWSYARFVAERRKGLGIGPTPPLLPCEEVIWFVRGTAVVLLYVKDSKIIHCHCALT